MPMKKTITEGNKHQVISLHERWERKREAVVKNGKNLPVSEDVRVPFLYTLDLLIDSFGKKHVKKYCALCEPMRVMGEHRDQVIVQLVVTLFTSFFQSFRNYLAEVNGTLLKDLLDRRKAEGFDSWQQKLKGLVKIQIESDLSDFLEDVQKHLQKFAEVSLEEERKKNIINLAAVEIEKKWCVA